MAGRWEVEIRSFPEGRGICIIAPQIVRRNNVQNEDAPISF